MIPGLDPGSGLKIEPKIFDKVGRVLWKGARAWDLSRSEDIVVRESGDGGGRKAKSFILTD